MLPRFCLALAFATLLTLPARSAVLLQDNFDSVTSGNNINGRTLTVNTLNSNTWTAPTGNFLGNGSGLAVTESSTTQNSVSIDLGANFFTSHPGVYQLSLDITQANSSASSWIGLGFAPTNTPTGNLVANNGSPWLLFRATGSSNMNVYGGPNTQNALTTVTQTSGTHTFTLQLDTTGPNWVLSAAVDSVAVDLNGAAAGTSYTYDNTTHLNPTTSQYLVLSSGFNTTNANGSVDNFTFSSADAVPEPQLALLLEVGLMAMGLRRRRPKAVSAA